MAALKQLSDREAADHELDMLTWLASKLRVDRAMLMLQLEEKHRSLLLEMQQTFGLTAADDTEDPPASLGQSETAAAAMRSKLAEVQPRSSTLALPTNALKAEANPRSNSLAVPSDAGSPQNQAENQGRQSFLLPNSMSQSPTDQLEFGPRKSGSVASSASCYSTVLHHSSISAKAGNLTLPPSTNISQTPKQEQHRVSATNIALPTEATKDSKEGSACDGNFGEEDSNACTTVAPQGVDGFTKPSKSIRSVSPNQLGVVPIHEGADGSTWPQFDDEMPRKQAASFCEASGGVLRHLHTVAIKSHTRVLESWWWSLYMKFANVVKSQKFEVFFAGMILLNAILMMFDLQREGLQIGFELEFPTYNRKSKDSWPGSKEVFEMSEKVFAVVFTMELAMRVLAYRCSCFRTMWNYIDTVVVLLVFVPWIWEANMNMNPMIVRLARFGKLMKIVRIMRTTTFMASLKLLVTSISASLNTLFWSLCVLMIIQTFFGMLISYSLMDFLKDPAKEPEIKRQVFAYFGTFWRSMVTMFEIIFANWGPICRLLLDDVSESTGLFFVVYRCVIGFAILAVIQAVFIQQTMKTAAHDDQLCLEEKNREKAKFVERLHRVFNEIDINGDGVISWDEFEPMMNDERLQGLMFTLEVSSSDVHGLFQELDDGDGEISTEEFLKGISSLRGTARAMDLVKVMNIARRLEAKVDVLATKNGASVYEKSWKHSRSKHRISESQSRSRLHKSNVSAVSSTWTNWLSQPSSAR